MHHLTTSPHPLMMLPFGLLLLAIAVMPFINKPFWEHYYHQIAVVLGGISAGYYLLLLRNGERMLAVAHEYVSFMALIGSLFVVAGGIHIIVKGEATPAVNSLYLFIGALVANLVCTTGASMLLIRPWIRMNKYRVTSFHVIFFIFIISNVGGCLTPIGDPPLFLGYLKGVPFWWVVQNCWQGWLFAVLALVAIFYVIDRRNFQRAPREIRIKETASESWRFGGLHNLGFLVLILAAVFINEPPGLREALMVGAAVGSYFTTNQEIHNANDFSFAPIKEVAWLFLGIFATMVPVLDFLELHAGKLGIRTETQFFWLTGSLSGVLDNAPTYLTFLASAFGLKELGIDQAGHMELFLSNHGPYLAAISMGAVFFGAMTYIGNGPNFMVKAIADQSGTRMPSFFGYVARYSVPFLLPVLWLVSLLFVK